MARKAKYDWGKSRSGKYQKFETRLAFSATFDNASSPYSDSKYIDIAQCLSIVNRKLVRQGQVFKVKNMHLYSEDAGVVTAWKVGALPRTWPMFNAYKKARSLWNGQALEAFQNVGAQNLPKYYDFKVRMDTDHLNNTGSGEQLLPVDFDLNAAAGGEWVYSKMHSSDNTSDEYELHMLGGHMTGASTVSSDDTVTGGTLHSVGCILAYQQSRGLAHSNIDASGLDQQSYDNLRSSPWGMLTAGDNDQLSDTMEDHMADNDAPPYDGTNYPGTRQNLPQSVTVATARLPQDAQVNFRVPTFEAPLGLVRIECDAQADLDECLVEIIMDTEIIGAI